MKKIYFTILLLAVLFSYSAFAQSGSGESGGSTKLYSQMSYDEKILFVARKSEEVLAIFGRTQGDAIGAEGRQAIFRYVDSYAQKLSIPKSDSCAGNVWSENDLTSVFLRGSRSAALISEEFRSQKLPPQLGLYTAMIESRFCPCIQSPTGALGMFQFLASTGKTYGLDTKRGATPADPDERCQPKGAARAAGKLYREMIEKTFGGDAVGYPLAISSYNRGVGTTKRHIKDMSEVTKAERISFWVLLDNHARMREKLEKELDESSQLPLYLTQFENENQKYVPMFFAAAIIGENPKIFGINLPPLSQIK